MNEDTRRLQLRSLGFIEDEDDRRVELIEKSKDCELMGALRLNFFSQPKYLLPGVTVRLTLHRAKDTFALIHGTGNPVIHMKAARLYVRRVRTAPSVIRGHELGLAKKNAIYPYTRGQVITYSVAQGSYSHSRDDIFSSSMMPKFVIVGMVLSEAYNGDTLESDPFAFNHFNMQSIALYRDGQALPYREAYEPNFGANIYVKEYMKSIIHSTQHLNTNMNNGISLEDFAQGKYCFFTFNLAPDFDMNQCQLPRDGNLRLEVKFRSALPKSINMIVYGMFDAQIQITKERRIVCTHVH